MNANGDLETNIVRDDEVLDEFSAYPDKFFDLLSSSPEMLKDYLENKELYHIKKIHPSLIRKNLPNPFPGISLQNMFRANFIMVNSKVIKNRWGPRDK